MRDKKLTAGQIRRRLEKHLDEKCNGHLWLRNKDSGNLFMVRHDDSVDPDHIGPRCEKCFYTYCHKCFPNGPPNKCEGLR